MSRVPDRKRLRREYLADKGGAFMAAAVCTALFLPATLIALVTGGAALLVLVTLLAHLSTSANVASMLFVGLAGISGFAGGLAWIFWHGIREASQQVRQLEYVPPMKVDQLPIAEVLVRGTRETTDSQDKALLRAVTVQTEDVPEQLLRIVR